MKSYSRRELYAAGEFLGDSATQNKVGGGRIYGGGGGGGPTTSTVTQSNIPDWLRPQTEALLGGATKEYFTTKPVTTTNEDGTTTTNYEITGVKPYIPYSTNPEDYIAGFSPLQQQVMGEAANMYRPEQFGMASRYADIAGAGGMESADRAYGYGQTGADIGLMGLQAQDYGRQVGDTAQEYARRAAEAGEQYRQQVTDPYAVQTYMSPYQQNVTDVAKAAAQRDYDIQRQARQAQAAKVGAFGGSRQAIEEAEANRALNAQLQNIQTQGLQSAYDKAMQSMQYGSNLGLQGLAGAQQGLGTALQGGQLGLSGIGTALQGQQVGLQGIDRQLAGTAQGMQGAQVGLQGVQGAQAGYGLANQAASNLANIGTQQQQADIARMGFQNQLGQQQQAYQQQLINQQIQDYATQQQYPLMQLGFMSNMLRGLPMQATTTQSYMPTANPLSQMIGTLGAGANIYNAFKAEGGQIKSYAKGGIASYDIGGNVKSDLYRMDQDALEEIAKNTTSHTIRDDAKQIARLKQLGLAKANGGIIAFADGKTVRGMTAEDYVIPDSEELKARREADIAAALALKAKQDADAADAAPVVTPPADNTGITQVQPPSGRFSTQGPGTSRFRTAEQRAANPIGKTAAEIRRGNVVRDAGTAAAVRQGIVQAKKEEIKKDVADAANAEVVKDEVQKAADRNDLGETTEEQKRLKAAKKSDAAPVASASEKPAESLTDKRSIKAASATDTTGTKIPGLSPLMQHFYDKSMEKQQTLEEIMAEQQAIRDKYVGPDTRPQERAELMAEKASRKDEAARQKSLRLAAFFANWGSTPGPTLIAGMTAFQKAVPGLIEDEKEARKAQGEVDKIIRELNRAERLEKEGHVDAAMKIRTEQGKNAKDLNKTMLTYLGQKEIAQTKASGSDKIQQEKYLLSAQKELREARTALTNLQSKNKELYKAANAPALENEPKAYTDKRNKAKAEVARLEAQHLAQIEEAENTLAALRKHGDIVVPSKKETDALGTAANPIKLTPAKG